VFPYTFFLVFIVPVSAIFLVCEGGDTLKCSDEDQSMQCAGMALPVQEFSVLRCGQRIRTGITSSQQKSECSRRKKEEGWKEAKPLTPEELGREWEFISLPAFEIYLYGPGQVVHLYNHSLASMRP
jgi:hypothetical protein